jgi:REP element-mobilizing transposase RayT
MIRGIEGREIFQDDQDREAFVSRLRTVVKETGTKILAWVLMNNHVHLLLFSGPQGIAKFMRRLLTGYALRYNRRHNRYGHLFQNRYKSVVCEEEPYLLELIRYIHLNPLRASIVKNLKELDQYPWSGHGALMGKVRNEWQERNYVLRQFSESEGKAVAGYRKFMEEGKDQGRRPELVGGGLIRSLGDWSQVRSLVSNASAKRHDDRILGGDDFVTGILKEADKNLKRQFRPQERKNVIEELIRKVCHAERITEQELRLGGRRRRVSTARAKISYHLSHELGIPLAEIARHMGVCTSAVAKAVQNFESK